MADVTRIGDRIAATADSLSAAFARELGRVLRDAERALRPILRSALDGDRSAQALAARGVGMRRALRQALTEAGYDALVEASTIAAVERMSQATLASRLASAGAALVQPDPNRLRALALLGQTNLLQVGDDVAAALWRSLSQFLFTVRPTEEILQDLADVFEDEVGNIGTLFDTQVSIFGRQVEALATADAPADQPFLYVGPVDFKTRDWCLDRVGTVYTRDRIEAMDNGQLANPFVTGGGYNCRHVWMAVQSEELRALVNTGERAPEYRLDVAQAVAMKANRRRRAAA